MTIITLAKKVKAMREVQKQYFSTRSKKALIQSKELEKEVDQAIAELEHLQLEVPGALQDSIDFLDKKMLEAEDNVNVYTKGMTWEDDIGMEHEIPPSPAQAQQWQHIYNNLQQAYKCLLAFDRLQRKLNQKEETHEA